MSFRNSVYHNICTNQFHLPKNDREVNAPEIVNPAEVKARSTKVNNNHFISIWTPLQKLKNQRNKETKPSNFEFCTDLTDKQIIP